MTDLYSAYRIQRTIRKAKRQKYWDAAACITIFAVYWAWVLTR